MGKSKAASNIHNLNIIEQVPLLILYLYRERCVVFMDYAKYFVQLRKTPGYWLLRKDCPHMKIFKHIYKVILLNN